MQHDQAELYEVHLQQGPMKLSVCPALGGAITRLAYKGLDLLRAWDGSDNVRCTAGFVLAPFSNRVGGAGFNHEGVHYPLRNISPDFPLPIHGVAWKRAWSVAEHDDTSLTLKMTHRPVAEHALDWPFAFELEHRLRLAAEGVELQLRLRNLDERSMPAGLGWHPYFARHAATILQFTAQSVWLNDDRGLPVERSELPAYWDFHEPRPLDEPGLDNCFAGWNGQARIGWPQQGIELSMTAAPALGHLVVFVPPAEKGFFALEPVTHANNALGMNDPAAHGISLLAPGEVLAVSCHMGVRSMQA